MCLVALALGISARFPLVVAANRDEFFAREAAPLDWWTPDGHARPLLGGRDLAGGGTWLGLTRAGRLALLTNVREPGRSDTAAPSRGTIVPLWLRGDLQRDAFVQRLGRATCNGFNLIALDVARGDAFFASNRSAMRDLRAGCYGLSNAGLDTPWPKVLALKAWLAAALAVGPSFERLRDEMFEALADRRVADDDALPDTGVPRDWERLLSSAFIDAPGHGYGTRCSTLVIGERVAGGLRLHVVERSFDAARRCGERQLVLDTWPAPEGADQSVRAMSTCAMPTSS